MKTRWIALWGVAAVVLQLMWPPSKLWYGVTPNLFLVCIILLSVYVEARRLVWFGFIGGFLFDMMGAQQFGFHMAFYILLALVLKFVWKLDKGNLQSASLLLATLVFTLLYYAVAYVAFLAPQYIAQWRYIVTRLLVEAAYNSLLVAVSISVIQLRQRGIISS